MSRRRRKPRRKKVLEFTGDSSAPVGPVAEMRREGAPASWSASAKGRLGWDELAQVERADQPPAARAYLVLLFQDRTG